MAASYADDARLLELYPELEAAYSSALREVWLGVAQGIVFADMFGDTLDAAHASMAAHLLDAPNNTAAKGKVASKSVGPASITFAVAPVNEELAETKYGRVYLAIRRSRMSASVVVVTE